MAQLARACGADRGAVVTLMMGAEVDDTERERAINVVASVAGGADLDVIGGGQWPARYLLGVE